MSPQKQKVRLTGVQETLLLTLRARARDADLSKPIIGDKWARYVLNQIEGGQEEKPDRGLLTPFVALRTRSLDSWTTRFLEKHVETGATVVSLACGLDSRSLRLERASSVRWIDIELPDVVQLRNDLLPRPSGDYQLLAASATDLSWLQNIPADRPTLVIFEGLSMYLSQAEGEDLLEQVSNHFTSGEIIFDAVRPVMITFQNLFRDVKKTGAVLKWAVGDPRELEARHARLKLLEVRHHSNQDGLSDSSAAARLVITGLDYVPFVWGTGSHLRFGIA